MRLISERQGLAKARRKTNRKSSWVKRKLYALAACAFLAVAIVIGNWFYQVWQKPTELIGVFDKHFEKSPEETWRSYSNVFKAKSTGIMRPEFLAALAQAESSGNPVVRTYWKLNWAAAEPTRIFAPASSAVGLFQITSGTFEETKDYCIRDGRAIYGKDDGCNSESYNRVIPAHSVEMISARLQWHTNRLINKYNLRRAGLHEKQNLATIIHLCGLGRAERLARVGLKLRALKRCGDHNPVAYIKKVQRLQRTFRTIARREALLASRD